MKIHIVQKGDTLWKIAQKYGVDFQELKKLNSHLSNPDLIMPGMKIKIPTGGIPIKKEAAYESNQETAKEKEAPKKETFEHPFANEKLMSPIETEEEEETKTKPSKPYVPPIPNVHQPYYPNQKNIHNYFMPFVNMNDVLNESANLSFVSPEQKPTLPKKPENVFHGVMEQEEYENNEEENNQMASQPPYMPSNFMNGGQWQPYYAPVFPNVQMPPNQYVSAEEYDDDEMEEAEENDMDQPDYDNVPPMAAPAYMPQYCPQPFFPFAPYPYAYYPYFGCTPVTPVYPGSGFGHLPMPYSPIGYGPIPVGQWVSPEMEEDEEKDSISKSNIYPVGSMYQPSEECGCGGAAPYMYYMQPMMPYGMPYYPPVQQEMPYAEYDRMNAKPEQEEESDD